MIAFACAHCGHKLKVKDELAGKKGKCPHCGQSMRVPETVPAATHPNGPMIPPVAGPLSDMDAPTLLPGFHRVPAAGGATDGDTEGGNKSALEKTSPGVPADLVNFLAPARKPGELGWLGPYRVLKVLGAGGMGVVYKAEDPNLQRSVALKAMLPALAASGSGKERFLREARSAAAVKHDHIVTIYQVGEDRGVPFLAMEFLEGQPLEDRLSKEAKLPIGEALHIGREIAEGLAAAHERGLIHRDIKPANIWLESPRRRVKILDFGLARAVDDQSQLTQQGAVIGTPAYMAPEQARGEQVDHRCDLFSLGCVLYRMCAGHLPFKGNDTISTLVAVATETPRALLDLNPRLPAGLVDLVNRLLAKKPNSRPASAQQVASELSALEASLVGRGPTAVLPPPPRKETPATPARSWRRFAILGAVILLLGGGLAAALLLPKGQNNKQANNDNDSKPPLVDAETLAFFNGKDLDGWEGLPEYWSVKDGALVGAAKDTLKLNTFLCSKKKYGDFELKCDVRLTGDQANSGIQVRSQLIESKTFTVLGPQGDMGPGYWGTLFGEKFGGMMKAAPAAEVARVLKPNDFNRYSISCVGPRVTIKLNDLTTVDDVFSKVPDEGIIAWQLHPGPPLEVTFKNIEFRERPSKDGWVQLFNGKDLTGWKLPEKPSGAITKVTPVEKDGKVVAYEGTQTMRVGRQPRGALKDGKKVSLWRVENGALVGGGPPSHLFSERGDYENFQFRVEAMINTRGNSGQFFRAWFGPGVPMGYEAQIALPGADTQYTGSLFGIARIKEPLHKVNEWFTQEVIALGDHIIIKVNDKMTVDTRDSKFSKGHFALQNNTPQTIVRFRKIEVRELSPPKSAAP